MPSVRHEASTYSLHDQPEVALGLLAATGIELPKHDMIHLDSANLPTLQSTDHRADAVITLRLTTKAVLSIVLEIQLRWDDEKTYAWPAYIGNLWERRRCPVLLLVICLNTRTANRCAEPIHLGHPGLVLTPSVIGPQKIPHVTDVDLARAEPALTVLSALAHPGDKTILDLVPAALSPINPAVYTDYTRLLGAALPAASRRYLEGLVKRNAGLLSEFANKHLEDGRTEGRMEGRAEALGEAVLALVDDRKIPVGAADRQRIATCRDEDLLLSWLRRAATATAIDEVFA
jgi:hypothetical protein